LQARPSCAMNGATFVTPRDALDPPLPEGFFCPDKNNS
jgi:hypothetical protein